MLPKAMCFEVEPLQKVLDAETDPLLYGRRKVFS